MGLLVFEIRINVAEKYPRASLWALTFGKLEGDCYGIANFRLTHAVKPYTVVIVIKTAKMGVYNTKRLVNIDSSVKDNLRCGGMIMLFVGRLELLIGQSGNIRGVSA